MNEAVAVYLAWGSVSMQQRRKSPNEEVGRTRVVLVLPKVSSCCLLRVRLQVSVKCPDTISIVDVELH